MRFLLTALLCALCVTAGFSQSIVSGEYYFDNDPGLGNGTSFTVTPADSVTWNGPVPVTGLNPGYHALFIRFKNSQGRWSHSEGRYFLLQQLPPANNNIVAAEYFFDNDPGIGNATPLAVTPADSMQITAAIPVVGLTNGFHSLNIRVQQASGVWSLFESRSFFVQTWPVSTQIAAMEYFIDSDPGFGNGISIPVGAAADSVQVVADITVPALTDGTHILYVRAQTVDGKWSHWEPREFTVCATYGALSNFGFIVTENDVYFSDSSSFVSTRSWNFGDGNTSDKVNPRHSYSNPGTYNVCLTTNNACGSNTLCNVVRIQGISDVQPNRLSATGTHYVHLIGYFPGFTSGAVYMVRDGYADIEADTILYGNENLITVMFNLNQAPTGKWGVALITATGSDTLQNAIDVGGSTQFSVSVDVTGPFRSLPNTLQRHQVRITNTGYATEYMLPVAIKLTADRLVTMGSHVIVDSFTLANLDTIPVFVTVHDTANDETYKAAWLVIPFLAPGATHEIDLAIISLSISSYEIEASVLPMLYDSATLQNTFAITRSGCDFLPYCVQCMLDLMEIAPGLACVSAGFQLGCTMGRQLNCIAGYTKGIASMLAPGTFNTPSQLIQECDQWNTPGISFGNMNYHVAGAVAGMVVYCTPMSIASQLTTIASLAKVGVGAGSGIAGLGLPDCQNCVKDPAVGWNKFHTVGSMDPNVKYGPQGETPQNYISGKNVLNYRIDFENVDTATAPASRVVITDVLDTTRLDMKTFTFTGYGWSDQSVLFNQHLDTLARDFDLRPLRNCILRVEGRLDKSNGVVAWTFTALDTLTYAMVTDPFDGFLPPNVTAQEGQGFVQFSIMPKAGVPHLAVIQNTADIVFDYNAPIVTPTWVNTVDTVAPSSSVLPLTAMQNDAVFTVKWAGADAHAGIHDFVIYVSEDGAPYKPWRIGIKKDSSVFHGAYGRTYRFYSTARDHVFNREKAPVDPLQNPDAITTVVTALPNISSNEATLDVFPNPLNNHCTVQFTLPDASDVRIEITDVAGKKHLSFDLGMLKQGIHQHQVNAEALPAGVYVCKMIFDNGIAVRKVTIVR